MSKTWIVQNNVAFALIPKSGSSSIKSTLYNHTDHYVRYHWNDEIDHVDTRVMFLREPINRIHSAYRFFKNQHELGCKHVGNWCPTGTFEQFIDHVLQQPNPHWDSQVKQVTDKHGLYVPTITHKFEDIGEMWSHYSDATLNHKNAAPTHYDIDAEYRIEELLAHTEDDMLLWNNCTYVTPRG